MAKTKAKKSKDTKQTEEQISWPRKAPKIKITSDYSKFRLDKANRPVDPVKVERFKNAMKQNPHIFRHNPIWVGKDGIIIDGQHRFTAAKELGAPIYYTKDESSTVVMAGEVNKNNNPWKIKEWVHHYSKRGVSNYEELVEYGEKYMEVLEGPSQTPPWRTLAALYSQSTTEPGGEFSLEVSSGGLTDNGKQYLEEILSELVEIQKISGADFLGSSTVLSAYSAVKKAGSYREYYDDFDYKTFKKQLKRRPDMLTQQRDKNDYKRMFEDIYNYKQRKRVRFT